MSKNIHLSLDLRGAVKNFRPHEWVNCVTVDDRTLTPDEVLDAFIEEIAAGKRVMPMCMANECPDFDYSGKGCPGHEHPANGGPAA